MPAETAEVLDRLYATVKGRKGADPTTSYSAKLLAKGPEKCAKKLGEEGVEVALAGAARDREGLISESADLLYHLTVLWVAVGVAPEDVYAALAEREGRSGLEEKRRRGESN